MKRKHVHIKAFDNQLTGQLIHKSLKCSNFLKFLMCFFLFFVCVFQTMPTDMCALQDFDEPDKLHIQINDVITIIEGRWVLMNVSDIV